MSTSTVFVRIADPYKTLKRGLKMAAVIQGQTIQDYVRDRLYAVLDAELGNISGPNWWRPADYRAMRAERRAGELLKEIPKAKGAAGNPGGQGATIVRCDSDTTQTLADLGITKRQSSDWQKPAGMPEDESAGSQKGPVATPDACLWCGSPLVADGGRRRCLRCQRSY